MLNLTTIVIAPGCEPHGNWSVYLDVLPLAEFSEVVWGVAGRIQGTTLSGWL